MLLVKFIFAVNFQNNFSIRNKLAGNSDPSETWGRSLITKNTVERAEVMENKRLRECEHDLVTSSYTIRVM